jgi:hypothetical protein
MKLHQQYNERPLTPDELTADKLKWMSVKPEGTMNPNMELFAPGQTFDNTHQGEEVVEEVKKKSPRKKKNSDVEAIEKIIENLGKET